MRIALANIRFPPTPDDSVRLTIDAIDQASREGVEIVCFPECYVPGYRDPTPAAAGCSAQPDVILERGDRGHGTHGLTDREPDQPG